MRRKSKRAHESFVWISFSDLLTTLLLSFIVIAVSSIVQARDQVAKIEEANKEELAGKACIEREETRDRTTRELQVALTKANESVIQRIVELKAADSELCKEAGIEINESGDGIRVFINDSSNENEWFADGTSTLGEKARQCLGQFSQIWISTIINRGLKANVEKLTIEGHTNSNRFKGESENGNFLQNLRLSQQRALAAATYMLEREDSFSTWKREKITALGKSYLETIKKQNSSEEDYVKSKRLEFRVKLLEKGLKQ